MRIIKCYSIHKTNSVQFCLCFVVFFDAFLYKKRPIKKGAQSCYRVNDQKSQVFCKEEKNHLLFFNYSFVWPCKMTPIDLLRWPSSSYQAFVFTGKTLMSRRAPAALGCNTIASSSPDWCLAKFTNTYREWNKESETT